jgi:hypothetical protein
MLGCRTYRRSAISAAFTLMIASLFPSSGAFARPYQGKVMVNAHISCMLPDSSVIERTVDVGPDSLIYRSTGLVGRTHLDLRVTNLENISWALDCFARPNRTIQRCNSSIFQTIDERTVQSTATIYPPSRISGPVRFAHSVVQQRERSAGKNTTMIESLETHCVISLRTR